MPKDEGVFGQNGCFLLECIQYENGTTILKYVSKYDNVSIEEYMRCINNTVCLLFCNSVTAKNSNRYAVVSYYGNVLCYDEYINRSIIYDGVVSDEVYSHIDIDMLSRDDIRGGLIVTSFDIVLY